MIKHIKYHIVFCARDKVMKRVIKVIKRVT